MSAQNPIQYSDDGQWWWDGSAWRAVSTDPPPVQHPAAVATVPSELVAVVHPHAFVAANPGAKHKYVSPANGAVVERNEVAVLALMLPLLTLWDEGLVEYTHTVSKKMMITFNSVKAKVIGGGDRPAFSGQLLTQLRSHEDVDSAVRKWLGREHPNPWNYVIASAVNEGVERGVYRKIDAHRNALAAAFKGSHTLEIDQQRAAAMGPEVNRLAAVLGRHRQEHAELHDQMWKKINSTINGNTERDNNNNDF